MRPRLFARGGAREIVPALTVLLIPKDPYESTAFFRFQVMRSPDTRELYEHALRYLQADYFQSPESFSDKLAAVLPASASRGARRKALRPISRSSTKLSLVLRGFELERPEAARRPPS
jgi:hypothetical protein